MNSIDDIKQNTGACVYRLYWGDRFVVVKGKSLASSVFLIEKGYAAFLAAGGGRGRRRGGEGQKESDGVNTYYFKFYQFIKRWPQHEFRIDVIFESTNSYLLLKMEELELRKSLRDRKCLNSNVTAYIPKFRHKTASYGWIPINAVLNFKKFLKHN